MRTVPTQAQFFPTFFLRQFLHLLSLPHFIFLLTATLFDIEGCCALHMHLTFGQFSHFTEAFKG